MSYFNNHNHTDMSNALLGFPDVICKIPDLIQRAYDLGLNGIAITEHEGISSHIKALDYYDKMEKDRPFTLALGNEIYLLTEEEDNLNRLTPNTVPYYHFILTALDTEGHHQLRLLSTRAWLRAWKQGKMFRRPTYYSDLEEIIKPNQGHVIASTACLGSRIDKLLLESNYPQATFECYRLQQIFGKDNFYLEIQPAKEKDTDQSKANRKLWKIHQENNIKIIPTTDSHYLRKEDAFIHKVYLQSQEGDREVDDFYATAYLMDEAELREHLLIDFNEAQIDQMFEWSCELGERIKGYNIQRNPIIPQLPLDKIPDFTISHVFSDYYDKYPNFDWYSNRPEIHEQYFFSQIERGLQDKIVNKGKPIEQYIARLDEEWKELKIISEQLDTSMASYYSTMSEIIELIWQAGSLAMPARGSAAGFLTCYLLEVTQIDPVPLGDYMPSWRHLNHQRGVELPDIDNDSEASKKKAIVDKMKEYFGEDKVINVGTFSKISSKTAIERACKGLDIPNDKAAYFKSLIPVNRGKVSKLKDAVYGNKDKGISPAPGLKSELSQYPHLLESALALEGLITNRGTHAAGVLVCNTPYTDYIAAMRSADGTLISCYDLWDDEAAGCIKFDMLTVEAADKIHRTMDYLLENGKIKDESSLKETYYKWVHPDVLDYKTPDMWDILPTIYSVFQFDTPISTKALSATRPHSVMDLSAANSLLRLMPDNADETPIDRYIRYKQSKDAWLKDTTDFGLNKDEQAILWKYLADACGMADSQEKVMRLSMDEHTAGYTLKEANKLRKSIAKKDEKLQAEAKQLFFDCCKRQDTREIFADYIWNVVFAASMGYSFSQLHSYSYSIIALQELNLNYYYPRVYWNCACLSVEASGTDEENTDSTDYGEMAKAIYKMKKYGVGVHAPSINDSNIDFTPREKDSAILFGLGGIAGINIDISRQILSNRPYTSFADFYNKNAYKDSLVTNSKFIQLIKAGCFDEFEPNRIKVMKQYIVLSTPAKSELTMQNLPEIMRIKVKLPRELTAPYNFKRYVCSKQFLCGNHPQFKSKKLYWLDNKALRYFNTNCRNELQEGVDWFEQDDMTLVVDKAIEKLFKPIMEALKEYINKPEFIKEYNKCVCKAKYEEMIEVEDINKWGFEACAYYPYGGHELSNLDLDRYNISQFKDLPEEPVFIEKSYGKRSWKQYDISAICGTVLARNDNNHLVSILTPTNEVVNIKFNGGAYAHYRAQISEQGAEGKKIVRDKSWLERGSLVIVAGYRRGDDFVAKKYKSSVFNHQVQKIDMVNEDGSAVIRSTRYGFDVEE